MSQAIFHVSLHWIYLFLEDLEIRLTPEFMVRKLSWEGVLVLQDVCAGSTTAMKVEAYQTGIPCDFGWHCQ